MSQPTSAPPQLSNMNHMFAPSPHHHHPHHHHHQSHDNNNNNSNNANSSSSSGRAINNNTTSINVVGTSSSRALPGILDDNSNNNNRPTISAYNPMTKNQFLQHVIHNHIQQVKVALDHQPDLIHAKTTDHFHYTALHRASQLGFIEIVDLLLNKGADINELSDRVSWRACLLAAKHGHVHVVKSLLDAGEDVNVQLAYTKNRFTCLHFAAQYGHSDLARMLLQDYKARIDIVSANGLRPIHTAANFGNFEIVDLILAAGENINERHNSPWKYTPLHWAVQENKTNTVELLLKRGADVNSVTGNTNLTPLIQSATKNFPDIARLLLAYGADYRIANKHGLRAVHIAASSNSVEALRVILDHASPSELYALAKSNARECDPLRFAITAKAKDCVLELINRGVNTNGVLEWMEEWDLISKNPCPILETIRNHEASIVYRRGIVMQNCAATKKFVDIEIITQTM